MKVLILKYTESIIQYINYAIVFVKILEKEK